MKSAVLPLLLAATLPAAASAQPICATPHTTGDPTHLDTATLQKALDMP